MSKRRTKPTSPLAKATLAALTYLDGRVHKPAGDDGPKIPGLDLTKLERQVTAALLLDENGGGTTADGYSRGGGGGAPSDVKLTGVEGAASSRIADSLASQRRRNGHDPVHEHTKRAAGEILRAVEALRNAEAAMVALARITDDAPIVTDACELCVEHHLANPRTAETYGTVGGRLTKGTSLCGPHRTYIEKHGQPPTAEQSKHHDATGTWRIRTSA